MSYYRVVKRMLLLSMAIAAVLSASAQRPLKPKTPKPENLLIGIALSPANLAYTSPLNGSPVYGNPVKLTYTFAPDAAAPASLLHVTLAFQGNAMGSSRLVLPTTYAGQRDLFASIRNVKSLDPEIEVSSPADNGTRDLHYPPSRLLEISYELVLGKSASSRPSSDAPPTANGLGTGTEVIFNGQNGLIHPQLIQTSQVQVNFRWKNLPRDWVVATSFGARVGARAGGEAAAPAGAGTGADTGSEFGSETGLEHGPEHVPENPEHPSGKPERGIGNIDQSFTGEWSKVFDAVFAAGDLRVTQLAEEGEALTFATNGKWPFTDRQAAEQVLNIFRAERKFWGEVRADRFLVILTPDEQNSGTSDGTVFTGAFLFHLSRKQTFGVEEKSLLAHEIFHIWNPYSMGLPAGEATEWFTEGFTHYYQDRILLQSGVLTYPDYLKRLNPIVAAYRSSPDRNWTQRQWLERTHTDAAEYALPYKRGAMIALWLDQRLRKSSAGRSSLDDRMYNLVDGQEKLLTAGYLISNLSNGLPKQDADLFRSFISEGTTIPLPTELDLGCATLIQPAGAKAAAAYYKPTGKAGCQNQLSARGNH